MVGGVSAKVPPENLIGGGVTIGDFEVRQPIKRKIPAKNPAKSSSERIADFETEIFVKVTQTGGSVCNFSACAKVLLLRVFW